MAEWASQFEGEHGATELVGLAVDAKGDVALAGQVLEEGGGRLDGGKDAIVMKLASSDGGTLWTRKLGTHGTHDWSTAIAADRDGNFFVSGQTEGHLFTSTTTMGEDIWVAKLGGQRGEVVWGYQVGSSGQDAASALAVDPNSGDVVICGSTTGPLFQPARFEYDPNNVASQRQEAQRGKAESFCAKLAAADGQVVWGSRLSGGPHDGLLAAAVDPDTGDVFAAGFTSDGQGLGGSDYLAVRLDGLDGREMWRASGGGGWLNSVNADAYVRDSVCAIAADGLGDVVIAGNTEGALFVSTVDGQDTDAFVSKLNGTDGSPIWGWQGSSSGNDFANAVAVDSAGDVYACGSAFPGFFGADDWRSGEGGNAKGGGGAEGGKGEAGARASEVADMFIAKLNGRSGELIWGEQFGSGADDHAVGLVLGPTSAEIRYSSALDVPWGGVGSGEFGRNNPLYLTGWTRGALYSNVSARWQDGFAVKLSNPPPKTLGVLSGSMNAGTGARDSLRGGDVSDAGAANQAANEAAKGAVTIGFVGSFIGTAIFVSAALCLILRRASHGGGALSAGRYETKTTILVRRRLRKSGLDSGIIGGGSGSGGHGSPQITDGVELTLLSDGGDAGGMSPRSSRHGGGSGGISSSSGQSVGGSSRREASKNPPQSLRPPTFYL